MCDRDEACASAGYTRCAGLASLGSGLVSLTHAEILVATSPPSSSYWIVWEIAIYLYPLQLGSMNLICSAVQF